MSNMKDETGKIYGKLTVIEQHGKDKLNRITWQCHCQCGKDIVISGTYLRDGMYKSCGCGKFDRLGAVDESGNVFGKLTVLSGVPSRPGNWICKCECGKIVKFKGSELRKNRTSCGCSAVKGSNNTNWTGLFDISGRYWNNIQNGAKLRGHEFKLSKEYMWDMYLQQGARCAISGLPIQFRNDGSLVQEQTASIDRIDNSLGYVKGNVHWVHLKVNLMKQKLTMEEFLFLCRAITDNK